ncbi:MAG: MAPEG family protein [Methylococcaceae bacterium]|jgi:hypothetical protein
MLSAFYAAILALLIVYLSLRVIKLRGIKKVRLGDGQDQELQVAIRAQANATEYIPISLILLFLLESNHAYTLILHLGGSATVIGRLLHAYGLIKNQLPLRILGMQITIFNLIALALANLVYFGINYITV